MPDNRNNKEIGKTYQQKIKENQQETNKYQKTNQYQQEAGKDFLGNNQADNDRSGYIIPDMDEEAGMEFNTDNIMKAGKKDPKKKR
ncbi:MAG: hypothetical protein PHS83_05040 [Clostridia bacterium]|nr:hypothetical protein [Clostridia bacterium]